jgi:hypothetical protein
VLDLEAEVLQLRAENAALSEIVDGLPVGLDEVGVPEPVLA